MEINLKLDAETIYEFVDKPKEWVEEFNEKMVKIVDDLMEDDTIKTNILLKAIIDSNNFDDKEKLIAIYKIAEQAVRQNIEQEIVDRTK